jgi:4-azaleucine resistance transporter AzlC
VEPTRGNLAGVRVHRASFLAGARDIAPLMLGAAPFGLITGVTAVAAGIDAIDVTFMSLTVFAGASQLAAVALIGGGAAIWVVLLTVAMVNLRHLMYAAALAPYLRDRGFGSRAAVGALLVDHTYAFGSLRFAKHEPDLDRRDYLLGLGIPLWLVWTGATAVGAYAGAQLPSSWQLDFAVTLMFLALLIPSIRDRPSLVAALTGGGLALALGGLPYNLGLVSAALAGIAAGTAAETLLAAHRGGDA